VAANAVRLSRRNPAPYDSGVMRRGGNDGSEVSGVRAADPLVGTGVGTAHAPMGVYMKCQWRRRAISDTAVSHESVRESIGDPERKNSPKVPAAVTHTA